MSFLTLSYFLCLLAMHSFFASYYMSVITIPESLHGQDSWLIGLIVGVMGITGMVTRPFVGVLLDLNFPKKLFLFFGSIGVGCAFLGYYYSDNLLVMTTLRLLQGTATAMFTTTLSVVVSGYVPASKRGIGLGIFQSSSALSQVYAALLAVWMINNMSLEIGFLASAIFSFIACIFVLFLKIDRQPLKLDNFQFTNAQWISSHGLLPALIFTTQTLTFGAIIAFLPSISLERGLGNPGLFYTVYAITMFIMRFGSGYLSDVFGRKQVMLPALISSSFALVLIAFTDSQSLLLLAAIFYGIGFASVQVVGFAVLIDATPSQFHGSALATYTNAWDIGGFFGAVIVGLLIEASGFSMAFMFCACLPIGAIFVLNKLSLK